MVLSEIKQLDESDVGILEEGAKFLLENLYRYWRDSSPRQTAELNSLLNTFEINGYIRMGTFRLDHYALRHRMHGGPILLFSGGELTLQSLAFARVCKEIFIKTYSFTDDIDILKLVR
ncbi:MAG: hypothetical protein HY472_00080 [Candidatus Sungbacteria bacterium]|nr:hypothetical protein [Candidatus Sungbacteria bacterium]